MTDKLKPCPFCNGVATLNTIDLGETFYAVCMNCGIRTLAYESTQRAMDDWNRRADNDR